MSASLANVGHFLQTCYDKKRMKQETSITRVILFRSGTTTLEGRKTTRTRVGFGKLFNSLSGVCWKNKQFHNWPADYSSGRKDKN